MANILVANLPNERLTYNAGDYFLVDNAVDGKTYKFKLSNIVKSITFSQVISSPVLTTTVSHNLGYKPVVRVYDNTGQEVDVLITHVSINQFTVESNILFTGEITYK
jgi:hypothetical protein